MKKFRLLSVLSFIAIIAFVQCDTMKGITNPFDPKSPKVLFTPDSFSAEQKETEVFLSWEQKNVNISNFKIDRKVGTGDWTNIASPPKTATSFSDSNLEAGQQHQYRLYAVAGTNQSNMVFAEITPVSGAKQIPREVISERRIPRPISIQMLPTISTHNATNVTHESALLGGAVQNSGGSSVTERGIVYSSTVQNPTTSNGTKVTSGSGEGSFSRNIANLDWNRTYYVRAYAVNSAGTAYGDVVQLTTNCVPTLTMTHSTSRFAGYAPANKTVTYQVVLFNDKCWIAQNLGASNVATAINDNSEAAAGWYWQFNQRQGFRHDNGNRTPSSTWVTSIDHNSDWVNSSTHRLNMDPCRALLGERWRIPTSTEWGEISGWFTSGGFNSVLKLHAAGYLDFNSGNLNDRGSATRFWSSTQNNNTEAMGVTPLGIAGRPAVLRISRLNKTYGFPVRCVYDRE